MLDGTWMQQVMKATSITRDGNGFTCITSVVAEQNTIACGSQQRMTQYTLNHELGHAFDFRIDRGCPSDPSGGIPCQDIPANPQSPPSAAEKCSLSCYVTNSLPLVDSGNPPGTVMGTSSCGRRGLRGWGSSHLGIFDGVSPFQQHPCGNTDDCGGETAADLFLNWVYSKAARRPTQAGSPAPAAPYVSFRNRSWQAPSGDACTPADSLGGSADSSNPGDARWIWMSRRMDFIASWRGPDWPFPAQ
jgi:hypothetical protein